MKKAKRLLAFLLVAVFATNFGLVQPAFAAQIDESDPYEKRVIETVTMDGVTYDFQLSYQNGNRTITITNNSDNSIDVVQCDTETMVLIINGQATLTHNQELLYTIPIVDPIADPGWEVKTSGSHYISWAKGTTVAVVAAAISVYLGSLGPAGVIAAMGTAVLGTLAASCTGGTLYFEYQTLIMVGVNQQRWMWTFTASTGDYYGPYYDYVVI